MTQPATRSERIIMAVLVLVLALAFAYMAYVVWTGYPG